MTWIQNFSLMQKTIYFITSAIHIESFHHKIFKLQFFFLTNPNKNFYSFFNWIKKLTSVLLFSLPSSFHSFIVLFFILFPCPHLYCTEQSMLALEMSKWNDNELICLTCPVEFTAQFGSSLFSTKRLCFFIERNCIDLLPSSIILNSLSHLSFLHI